METISFSHHFVMKQHLQVFQRRMDGTVNFFRGWEQYRNGFGHAAGEYWLGMYIKDAHKNRMRKRKRIVCYFITNGKYDYL